MGWIVMDGVVTEPTFRCSGCKVEKTLDRFAKNKSHRIGHANWCKDCMRTIYTRPEYLERRKQKRSDDCGHVMLIDCRSRARKLGVPFNLTEEDTVVPALCPVLGIPLQRARGKRIDSTPTVDRIDARGGYVKGNVAVISWLANRLKSDCGDPAVFDAIAAYIRRMKAS